MKKNKSRIYIYFVPDTKLIIRELFFHKKTLIKDTNNLLYKLTFFDKKYILS